MAGELSSFDQVPDWQVDRLLAWHLLLHPEQARDGTIAGLSAKHGVPPELGAPLVDAAINRSRGWTGERAENTVGCG